MASPVPALWSAAPSTRRSVFVPAPSVVPQTPIATARAHPRIPPTAAPLPLPPAAASSLPAEPHIGGIRSAKMGLGERPLPRWTHLATLPPYPALALCYTRQRNHSQQPPSPRRFQPRQAPSRFRTPSPSPLARPRPRSCSPLPHRPRLQLASPPSLHLPAPLLLPPHLPSHRPPSSSHTACHCRQSKFPPSLATRLARSLSLPTTALAGETPRTTPLSSAAPSRVSGDSPR
mmetsp:Transcript_16636/g.49293  ORF Transcript_16636/g.49293 Transcript_16636/m.49293 type:complete len:232 (+) Transcript_16636:445-1140(+)